VACPYFYPKEKTFDVNWAFPQRLPLGAGYCGTCRTPAADEIVPSAEALRDFCNLGYATACNRMPADAVAHALRFSVTRDTGDRILLHYALERNHAPGEHGQLEYDRRTSVWLQGHPDACVQRQAECYLSSYMERRPRSDGSEPVRN